MTFAGGGSRGMIRSVSADAPRRSAWRVAIVLGLTLSACVAVPAPATAQSKPIVIPPAQLPPAATTTGSAHPPASPAAAPTPPVEPVAPELLPSNVRILRDSQGSGIVMSGGLTGKTPSALGVLRGVFAYSQAFDPNPALRLVLTDPGDRHAQAIFAATVHDAPVIGIAVVALSDTGGDVSVFYDYTDAFPESFARMRQALRQSGGMGTVVLSPIDLGDGSRIALPPGWRVTSQGQGSVDLRGPLGELMSLGASLPVYARNPGEAGYLQAPCCDPVKALQALFPQIAAIDQRIGAPVRQLLGIVEAQPTAVADGGEGAFILGNLSVAGRPYSYFALAEATAGFTDPWRFHLSEAMAPQPLFADELPTLLQIWKSYSADAQGFADRLQQALPGMDTMQRIVQSTAPARETADYNAAEGWDPVIRSVATSGGPAPPDNTLVQNLAAKLSADTGRSWRIVKLSALE
jgi:hypothetical protein